MTTIALRAELRALLLSRPVSEIRGADAREIYERHGVRGDDLNDYVNEAFSNVRRQALAASPHGVLTEAQAVSLHRIGEILAGTAE